MEFTTALRQMMLGKVQKGFLPMFSGAIFTLLENAP